MRNREEAICLFIATDEWIQHHQLVSAYCCLLWQLLVQDELGTKPHNPAENVPATLIQWKSGLVSTMDSKSTYMSGYPFSLSCVRFVLALLSVLLFAYHVCRRNAHTAATDEASG